MSGDFVQVLSAAVGEVLGGAETPLVGGAKTALFGGLLGEVFHKVSWQEGDSLYEGFPAVRRMVKGEAFYGAFRQTDSDEVSVGKRQATRTVGQFACHRDLDLGGSGLVVGGDVDGVGSDVNGLDVGSDVGSGGDVDGSGLGGNADGLGLGGNTDGLGGDVGLGGNMGLGGNADSGGDVDGSGGTVIWRPSDGSYILLRGVPLVMPKGALTAVKVWKRAEVLTDFAE